ncbi:MAG: hypothetical protein DLM60_17255 [Pseudonocardiales bacterium]|nr:MAG: hypothetical protein DLM60_17255 [Pseudonocardiales bacterium]
MAWNDPPPPTPWEQPSPYDPWSTPPPVTPPEPAPVPRPASPGLSNGAKIILGILAAIVLPPIVEPILNGMGTAGTVIGILIIPAALVWVILMKWG